MSQVGGAPRQSPPDGTTQLHRGGDSPGTPAGRVAMRLAYGAGQDATGELQAVLRRRLATIAVIGLVAAVIDTSRFFVKGITWGIPFAIDCLLILTAAVYAVLLLWGRWPLSLRALRGMELLAL